MTASPGEAAVLIVDDDRVHAESTADCLSPLGYACEIAESGAEGIRLLQAKEYDLVVTDLVMADRDGFEVLRAALGVNPFVAIIVVTGHGSVESAVEAMRLGATDYLLKPVNIDDLRIKVARALERQELRLANLEMRRRLEAKFGFQGIVGNSEPMQRLIRKVRQISDTDVAVLITGESGTGKELIAKSIHENSRRRDSRFIPVNCGAISQNLVESELFGHEKGAFTGAAYTRKGRFEYANHGTLFLDEIGDMPVETQVKLLRVLEDGEVYRVGSNQPIKVDVRILSATNQDLEDLIRQGQFREDLYWRLRGISVAIPPLRERAGDVPLLIDAYAREYARVYGKPVQGIDRQALTILTRYPWPGNVRELKNCIEEMVVVADGPQLRPEHIPERIHTREVPAGALSGVVGVSIRDMERELIQSALAYVKGNRQEAAKLLGIGERTLYRKLRRYGL
ncbi:MAG: sigma-54-dependent Fis family transcriptional regulator [Planctomycetes bacterium]|nr:sigma-54-dependent Fis family transcriptional regulator [Planctomycetota bacterium]